MRPRSKTLQRLRRVPGLLLLATSFILMASPSALSQQASNDRVSYAKHLVRVFYPELFGRNLSLKVRDDAPLDVEGLSNWFSLEISEPWHSGEPRKCDTPDVMSAYFMLTTRKNSRPLYAVHFGGAATGSDKLDSLREAIDGNTKYSDEEILEMLKTHGAKFLSGHEDQLLRKIPIKELESFLGVITVTSVTFKIRDAAQYSAGLPAANLVWAVYFTATRRGGRSMKYFLILEPFEGKVRALERMPLG